MVVRAPFALMQWRSLPSLLVKAHFSFLSATLLGTYVVSIHVHKRTQLNPPPLGHTHAPTLRCTLLDLQLEIDEIL